MIRIVMNCSECDNEVGTPYYGTNSLSRLMGLADSREWITDGDKTICPCCATHFKSDPEPLDGLAACNVGEHAMTPVGRPGEEWQVP